jgi:hypothetical protein
VIDIDSVEGRVIAAVTPTSGLMVSVLLEFSVVVVKPGDVNSVILSVMRKVTLPEAPVVLSAVNARANVK